MSIRPLLILSILVLTGVPAGAQPLSKTLLWRISGKDGHHPSYLYGTMHLTDERVFNLGDSLYAAISHSDGFAMELDPNSLSSFVVDELEKQLSNEKNLHELLSDQEYKKYGPVLARKLGKPESKITSWDILHEKSKWVRQRGHTTRMTSFLDVYLFDIARRQQKWTGGVEDLVDQQGIIEDKVDKTDILTLAADGDTGQDQSFQKLIGTYLRQDLEGLDSLIGSGFDRDRILVKRNLKMAMRMDSLSGERSMVFAVGAAHLPGKDGLITLLRAKGFRVEPVFSSRKIKSADYPVPELPERWEVSTDENRSYQVEMPGTPSDLKLYHVLKMKTFIDIFKNTGYVAMSIHSSFNADKTDSLLDVMAENIFRKKGKKDYALVTLNGARGRLYSGIDGDGYKKGYLLTKQNIVYMAMGTAVEPTEKNKADIEHFLRSFRVLDVSSMAMGGRKEKRFADSALAFSVLLPVEATLFPQKNPGWQSRFFMGTDLEQGVYYMFGSNGTIRGRYIENDSTLFQQLKKEAMKKLTKLTVDTCWMMNGQLAMEYRGKIKDADMTMAVRYIDRGNRYYVLIGMYPLSGRYPEIDTFFSSFAQIQYPSPDWERIGFRDSSFTTWAPQPFTLKKNDSTGTDVYTSYDSASATSYDIVVYGLGNYYWSQSDSAFWQNRVDAHLLHYRDSLIYKKEVRNGDARGWEWVKRQRTGHLYYRQRILLQGSRLYSLGVNTPEDQVHSPNNERFFEDFRFSSPATGNPYLKSKADLLLRDLFSADSATAEKARSALLTAPFGKKDLPLLYQGLLRVSRGDRKSQSHPMNHSLALVIEKLKDTGTFSFALRSYPTVPDSNGFIKDNLLRLMMIPDSTHFAKAFELLSQSPPPQAISFGVIHKLTDTPQLTGRYFPRLLPLLRDTNQRVAILEIADRLLDSNCLDIGLLVPYKDVVLGYTETRLKKILAGESYRFNDLLLIRMLGRLDDPVGNGLLQRFLAAKDNELKLAATGALLRARQPVNPDILLLLAADNHFRLQLYDLLVETGKPNLFPKVWQTQKAFAEARVFEAANDEFDEMDTPPVFDFLKERLVGEGKEAKRYFFFKLRLEKENHLVCAGPFDRDPAKLGTAGIHAHIYFKDGYEETRLEAQMAELLKLFKPE